MTFGEKIVALRKSKGMSQDQLAELLNVTRQSVSKWERDEVIADTDRILAISRLFGVSCDYLLDDQITDPAHPAGGAPKSQAEPAAETPPAGQHSKRYWHWLGLLPILWDAWDLVALAWVLPAFFGITFQTFSYLLPDLLLNSFPAGTALVLVFLLVFLLAAAKIVVGVYIIRRGQKRNRTLT